MGTHCWVYIYISAWASALLILERRQCEGRVCGISDTYRSRAFLYMAGWRMSDAAYMWLQRQRYKVIDSEPSGSGAADIL